MAAFDATLGPEDPQTEAALYILAALYRGLGENENAIPLFQRICDHYAKTLGAEDPHTGGQLRELAQLYSGKGDYSTAASLYERVSKIMETHFGPHHSNTGAAYNDLAWVYSRTGEYAKAESLLQRALNICEKEFGADHPHTALTLYNLAQLYSSKGDYGRAQSLCQRALKISEKVEGPEGLNTAASTNLLASIYSETGDTAQALSLAERALTIYEKIQGQDHPNTAVPLMMLSKCHTETGDYAKAEAACRRALQIMEKTLGADHPHTGVAVMRLATLYYYTGDYNKAQPLFQRVLRIAEATLGSTHPDTATALNDLGTFYNTTGRGAQAEPLFKRALEIRRQALGSEHPAIANTLNGLAGLYRNAGAWEKAIPLLEQALKLSQRTLGANHPSTVTGMNNLAIAYQSTRKLSKAEALFARALEISQKAFGAEDPMTGKCLYGMAFLYLDEEKWKEAAELTLRVRRIQDKESANVLSFTSERQRLAFQSTFDPYGHLATLGLAAPLAEAVLRHKGLVLDSLLEDRLVVEASADPKQREVIEQLRIAKQRLTQLLFEVPKDLSGQAKNQRVNEREKLSTQVEQLEAGLARQVAGLGKARGALSVTVAQVQSALPRQGMLVELVRYDHYVGKSKWETRYGAIVIAPIGEPKCVPLGSAAEIEKEIKLYQKSARGETDEATLNTVLRTLQERVWAPIEKALPPGTAIVIVSPDADLSFVSLATLLTPDDKFVGEKYSIRYVASGRDLLRETKTIDGPKTTMRVFANPDFAAKANRARTEEKTNQVVLRSTEMRDLESISLPNLPGTEKEAQQLEGRAKKSGWQPQTYLGARATEAELRKVNSPRILHLATHGFFLPEIDLGASKRAGDAEIPKGKLVNPMHRSGLAVAGAQTTLNAWAKGEVLPTEDDGILTAEELGGLKLDGTWLVALSACDTGGGEAKAGEGVMGLRRGFVQAGGQNLLMTLWPISDETTVNIMLDFYDAAFKTGNAPQALADTQRDWLVKLRKERGLLPAVQLAGPFIMSSQGKQ